VNVYVKSRASGVNSKKPERINRPCVLCNLSRVRCQRRDSFPLRVTDSNGTVNLDERLFRNFFFSEKLCHKLALVSLKLHNIAVLWIFDDATVAVKLLFAFLENDLLVDLRIDTLKPFKKHE
jgi:hypothetical protein